MKLVMILSIWATSLSVAVVGFTIEPRQQLPSPVSSTSALYLLPTQGNQLVAASSCAYDEPRIKESGGDPVAEANSLIHTIHHQDEATEASTHREIIVTPKTPKSSSLGAARSFVSRLFSLPSTLRHPLSDSAEDEGVLFPVVGFRYVADQPDHCRVLPTTSNPSCRLHPVREEVYGWWSAACPLACQDTDEEHSSSYCSQPQPSRTP